MGLLFGMSCRCRVVATAGYLNNQLAALPRDPLKRFLALARAFDEGRRWFQGAAPLAHNAFKLPIGKAVVRDALEQATR